MVPENDGVAADAGDRDRAVRRVELGDRLEELRSAMGSPQPGHIWCSWVRSRSGFWPDASGAARRCG